MNNTAQTPGDPRQPRQTDPALSSAVWRSATRLIPVLLLMYILAYLDRANLGFAKQSFQADRGISEAAYAFGAGILSIGYALFEVPSNIALAKFGARRWLARIMITWGLVAAAMVFVVGNVSFFTIRFLLGVAEAGFFPGAVFYMTFWFPNEYRSRVMGLFYFGAPLAFIFGGPLSGVLLDSDGMLGLRGWQWMFMVDGLLATVVGVFILTWLPNRPSEARWLREDERDALVRVCGGEEQGRLGHGPSSLLRSLTSWRVLYLAAIYFLIQMCVNGVVYYLPSQVGQLLGRRVGLIVALVTAVPWICAAVAAFFVPRLADKTRRRRLVGAVTMTVAAAGVGTSAIAGPEFALVALCCAVAGFISVQPVFWSFPTSYLGGLAAAGGLALVNSIGALAGFVAPQARVWADQTFGAGGGLYLLSCTTLLGAAMILALGLVAPSPATRDGPATR